MPPTWAASAGAACGGFLGAGVFDMATQHDIRVVTLLTGDEYFALRAMAEVSEHARLDASAEPAQVVRTTGAAQ